MANKIHYLDSRWLGITGVRTIAGGMLSVFKKAIEGFNPLVPSSISIASGIMTITYGTDQNYGAGRTINLTGAVEVALNKQYKVITRSANVITVATDQPDGPVTVGAIKTSYVPIPWKIVAHNTGTNKMVIKPNVTAPEVSFGIYIDDNQIQYTLLKNYATITGLLEGENDGVPSPLESQNAGGLIWGKSQLTTDTDVTSKPWIIITDGETLHWLWVHNHATALCYQHYAVGAYDNDLKGDTMRVFITGGTTLANMNAGSGENGMPGKWRSVITDSPNTYLLRDKMRVSPTPIAFIWDSGISAPGHQFMGGPGVTNKYPSSYYRGLSLRQLYIYKTDEVVGTVPGIFAPQVSLQGAFVEPTVIKGDSTLINRDILAVPVGYSGNPIISTYTGVIFYDLTGPWK